MPSVSSNVSKLKYLTGTFEKKRSDSKIMPSFLFSGWHHEIRLSHSVRKQKFRGRCFSNLHGPTENKDDIDKQKTTFESSSNDSQTITVAAHPVHHYLAGGMPCDPKPKPFLLDEYGEQSLHSLILLRHGESEWNSQNRYTGW